MGNDFVAGLKNEAPRGRDITNEDRNSEVSQRGTQRDAEGSEFSYTTTRHCDSLRLLATIIQIQIQIRSRSSVFYNVRSQRSGPDRRSPDFLPAPLRFPLRSHSLSGPCCRSSPANITCRLCDRRPLFWDTQLRSDHHARQNFTTQRFYSELRCTHRLQAYVHSFVFVFITSIICKQSVI